MKGPTRLPFASVYLDEQAQGPVANMLRRYLQATPLLQVVGTAAQRAEAQVGHLAQCQLRTTWRNQWKLRQRSRRSLSGMDRPSDDCPLGCRGSGGRRRH